MDPTSTHEITRLLHLAQQGDESARNDLLEKVYKKLHEIAARFARRERMDHSLQPTALLNEVYLKLFPPDAQKPTAQEEDGTPSESDWRDRSHFFAIAARQMRFVLVDYARRRNAEVHGGGLAKVSFEDYDGAKEFQPELVLHVHARLEELEASEPHLARLVELKYFGGLGDREIAEVLGISFARVRRDWEFARSWLRTRL